MTGFSLRLAIIAAAGSITSGCEYNGSPIHSRLTPTKMDERITARWRPGMTAPEAEHTARDAGLDPQPSTLPVLGGDAGERHGMMAYVDPPGLRILYTLHPYEETGELYFWFDRDERLERIAYLPPHRFDQKKLPEARVIVPPPEEPTP